jgi:hypothetical protein
VSTNARADEKNLSPFGDRLAGGSTRRIAWLLLLHLKLPAPLRFLLKLELPLPLLLPKKSGVARQL